MRVRVCECVSVCVRALVRVCVVRVQTDNERMWEFENWIWVLCNTQLAGWLRPAGRSTSLPPATTPFSRPLTLPLPIPLATVSTQSIY